MGEHALKLYVEQDPGLSEKDPVDEGIKGQEQFRVRRWERGRNIDGKFRIRCGMNGKRCGEEDQDELEEDEDFVEKGSNIFPRLG